MLRLHRALLTSATALLLALARPVAAECADGACCREVACACPEKCTRPAAGDTQAEQDEVICLGPDTPQQVVDALTSGSLCPSIASETAAAPHISAGIHAGARGRCDWSDRQTPSSKAMAELDRQPIITHPGGILVVRNRQRRGCIANWNQLVQTIERFGGSVEPDHTYRAQGPPPTPNDPQFPGQWPLAGWSSGDSCSTNDEWCKPDCNPKASLAPLVPWDEVNQHPPVAPVVLGMIDMLPYQHADLDDHIWTNPSPADPDEYPDDVHGYNAVNGFGISDFALSKASTTGTIHGLSVASIMAALSNNEHDMTGMVRDAQVILCKAATRMSEYAACLRYFAYMREHGVNIVAVNVSGGGNRCSCCVEMNIRRLRELGVLVVAAAGNDGCANGPFEPGVERCQEWTQTVESNCGDCPFYPASHSVSNVISVGASTCSSAPKRCSRYGRRSVHLFAPGHDILTLGDPAFRLTSAAAPHVTGVVGLLASTTNGATLDWRGLRNRILAGGRPSGSLLTSAASVVQRRSEETVSRRNLLVWEEENAGQALGSVSCKGQKVKRRLLPLNDAATISTAKSLMLRAMAITCESSDRGVPVQVQKRAGTKWADVEEIELKDDGLAPDECAGDGEHAGNWTAPVGKYRLRFWSGAEPSEDLVVEVTP